MAALARRVRGECTRGLLACAAWTCREARQRAPLRRRGGKRGRGEHRQGRRGGVHGWRKGLGCGGAVAWAWESRRWRLWRLGLGLKNAMAVVK